MSIPKCDLFIHAGDYSCLREPNINDTLDFNAWLGQIPCKYKIIIAGNHDTLFERDFNFARSLITNAIFLHHEYILINGLKIFGSPYCLPWDNWAFGISEEKLLDLYKQIPEGVDILITHQPPYGILDRYGIENIGSKSLKTRVGEINPRIHIFGHVHQKYGSIITNNTIFINCSLTDLKNEIIEQIFVFDYPDKEGKIENDSRF